MIKERHITDIEGNTVCVIREDGTVEFTQTTWKPEYFRGVVANFQFWERCENDKKRGD